ncbi:uncharacterized protein B0H18DRAFT_1037342 [Fomitopsis serialis]|uniref:uncharacterized protein n=1 Tax=Fomitopsis serialis TaxID=139415 RepID=UPI0020073EE0|nr:uncharacterized protein B0H18DRAFT_1037342 [Neoantrodia serialis]KAH9916820.1 hypothetical protein B0H18DRAFT_1037342 [Neoantrodia serialis]
MILTPSMAPPPAFNSATPSAHGTRPAVVQPPLTQASAKAPVRKEDPQCSDASLSHLKIPYVLLDASVVTHTMAARLAMSLLGHILFLKSQIPLCAHSVSFLFRDAYLRHSPVVQLARMPGGRSDTRAAKRRNDLLATIDTLESHMHTTFTALSTALARRKSRDEDVALPSTGTAHLAFVLGPSVGAARARIVYTVNGLEVKVWGERDDIPGPSRHPRAEEPDADDSEEQEEAEDDSDEQSESGDEEGSDVSDEESPSGPPSSRSPSPSPPASRSQSHTSSPTRELSENVAPPPAPRRASASPPGQVSSQTYAEEQQSLRIAERLLSRTLANACAEDGGGMSSELASLILCPSPTQTHILLRAPRRFAHPAWIPRQNLTRSLEGTLQSSSMMRTKKKGLARGAKTEGVWVGCSSSNLAAGMQLGSDVDEDEADEMIWWVWDGKIVGFSDW